MVQFPKGPPPFDDGDDSYPTSNWTAKTPIPPIRMELDKNVTKNFIKKIILVRTDITRVNTDAIVNPINAKLLYGKGGISDAIINACQPYRDSLIDELREEHKGIDKHPCHLFITPAYGNLSTNCKGIFFFL